MLIDKFRQVKIIAASIFTIASCLSINGCSIFFDNIEGAAPEGAIVPSHIEQKVLSPNSAITRMITSLSMKCVMLFGSKSPLVKNEFTSNDDSLNNLPSKVYSELIRSGAIKPSSRKNAVSYTLKSSINSNSKFTKWQMKFIDSKNNILWEKIVELKQLKNNL